MSSEGVCTAVNFCEHEQRLVDLFVPALDKNNMFASIRDLGFVWRLKCKQNGVTKSEEEQIKSKFDMIQEKQYHGRDERIYLNFE
jgi:hypothetical protein